MSVGQEAKFRKVIAKTGHHKKEKMAPHKQRRGTRQKAMRQNEWWEKEAQNILKDGQQKFLNQKAEIVFKKGWNAKM